MKLFKKQELAPRKQEMQKIEVRDLKEYLVKDFEQIERNEETIALLKERVEELEKIEMKYKATLITLEEFDMRVNREKEKTLKIEEKYNRLREDMKFLEEQKNNCIIREKQALDKINNVKDTILNEYKKELIEKIKCTKGALSKQKIYDLIEKY